MVTQQLLLFQALIVFFIEPFIQFFLQQLLPPESYQVLVQLFPQFCSPQLILNFFLELAWHHPLHLILVLQLAQPPQAILEQAHVFLQKFQAAIPQALQQVDEFPQLIEAFLITDELILWVLSIQVIFLPLYAPLLLS